MGYTVYNRSLYRNGFRPYGTTNTSAAASGMGGTPFDPEFLRGVHHQKGYPFTARGGWRLGDVGDVALTSMPAVVSPPWWTNLAPGIGAGVYELYQGVKLVFAPGDPTPVLNTDNLTTGKLTPDQITEIKQNAAQAITQASGGNADLAAQQIALVNNDIDATLNTQPIPWWVWAGIAGVFLAGRYA